MANVFLIGLGRKAAFEIASTVSIEHHTVSERTHDIDSRELLHAGMVFAGGAPQVQLSFLRRVRRAFPCLPVVVVTETMHMGDWLETLEAGATDTIRSPIARRQIQSLIESLVPTNLQGLAVAMPRGWVKSSQGR